LREQIEEDFKQLQELKSRVEQSTKALDRIVKENLNLKRTNSKNTEVNSKLLMVSKEKRDTETKYKKKAKKLLTEKKDL
jgi:hypothetical protein